MQDLLAFTLPQTVLWGSRLLGWRWLLFAYDWDTVIIPDNVTAFALDGLNLCTQYYPCTFLLRGGPYATVTVSGNGQFVCLSSAGCPQMTITSVTFICSNNTKSAMKMQGSVLMIANSSFEGCRSDTDGGVIQAYDSAQVLVEACQFVDIFSSGFGGAIAAYGSNLSILYSLIQNCSALRGGGAVWSAAFQDCYGSNKTQSTQLHISSSVFSQCSTAGAGGAVLADSSTGIEGEESLFVTIFSSHFYLCSSKAEGGALRIVGTLVHAQLLDSTLDYCRSGASGGAISSSDASSLSLTSCIIHDNNAHGMGGGALHLNRSFFASYNTSIHNNYAPNGGGGGILWQGWVKPGHVECPRGVRSSCLNATSSACQAGNCGPCNKGSVGATCEDYEQAFDYSSGSTAVTAFTDTAIIKLCGANNSARYGSCIATDFWMLQTSAMTGSVYSGISFNFTVIKQDAYGSTILSDSSSILEAIITTAETAESETAVSILGSSVSKVVDGVAYFQFAVKATFSKIDYEAQTATFHYKTFFSLEGIDAQSGSIMKSQSVLVNIQKGAGVCPQGFVLLLDQQDTGNGSAICTLCKPGSYSLSPLAHLMGALTESASCLVCPAGCDCSGGGADIRCEIGSWKSVGGIYVLTGCPAGFQLINSTSGNSRGAFSSDLQQCKACLPGEYIINTDTDTCQDCPPGTTPQHLLHALLPFLCASVTRLIQSSHFFSLKKSSCPP